LLQTPMHAPMIPMRAACLRPRRAHAARGSFVRGLRQRRPSLTSTN
jgi:hypothetical protein